MGERQVRLRHADGQPVETDLLELGDLRPGRRKEVDPVCSVDALRDRLDLLGDGRVELVDRREARRLLHCGDARPGKARRSLAAERVVLDPMLPEEGLGWFEEHGRPEHAVLTCRHHDRDAWKLHDAFGSNMWSCKTKFCAYAQ